MKIGKIEFDEKTVLYFTISLLIVFALIHLYVINNTSNSNNTSNTTMESFGDSIITSDQDLGNFIVTIESLDNIIISSNNNQTSLSTILNNLSNNIDSMVQSNISTLTTNFTNSMAPLTIQNTTNNTSLTTLNTNLNNSVSKMNSNINDNMPAYSVISYNGIDITNLVGWQLCDGTPLLYKSGGLTGINTPDLKGRFILGAGAGTNLTVRNVGDIGGEEKVVLQKNQMPPHTHYLQLNDAPFRNGGSDARGCISGQYGSGYTLNVNGYASNPADRSNFPGIGLAGNDQPHNNMPPYYALTYIIKQPIQTPVST